MAVSSEWVLPAEIHSQQIYSPSLKNYPRSRHIGSAHKRLIVGTIPSPPRTLAARIVITVMPLRPYPDLSGSCVAC